jgi:hypothetical protein
LSVVSGQRRRKNTQAREEEEEEERIRNAKCSPPTKNWYQKTQELDF